MIVKGCRMQGNVIEEVYRRYMQVLYYYAFSLCKNEAQAKDLVADTFLKAFTYLPDEHVNIEARLHQVLYHLYIDETRKTKRHPWLPIEKFISLKGTENPSKEVEEAYRKQMLIQMIQALPKTYHLVLYEFYFNQKSIQEISEQHHISISNIKIRLLRGQAMLKKEMEGHVDEI